ncbi:type IV secretion system protein [Cupriavidus basilensis]|uniref:type IV secretion system protein n=1 Tax=Cupriavidus basilensis TaxID=68895 RepID=UPI0007C872DE|nr:type IV secretion system protein [Cupriavidus basilensis]
MRVFRYLLAGIFSALLVSLVIVRPALAQASGDSPTTGVSSPAPPSNESGGIALGGPKGAVGEAIEKALAQFRSVQTSIITAAVAISHSLKDEADKLAFGLGIITLTLASLRFAATSDPVAAWTSFLETILLLGIFAAIYVGYDQFGPGILSWFQFLADKIAGTNSSNPGLVLASAAGGFLDAFQKAMDAASWYQKIGVALSFFVMMLAFVVCAVTSVVYTFFTALGEIQVAIGIVLGQIAVALGFSDYTRRFFSSWLDYMITGSMYVVVANIMTRLVSASFEASIVDLNNIGNQSIAGAVYALIISLFLLFLSFEIPKIAGSIWGGGGGFSGSAIMKMASGAGRGAWAAGKKLAKG